MQENTQENIKEKKPVLGIIMFVCALILIGVVYYYSSSNGVSTTVEPYGENQEGIVEEIPTISNVATSSENTVTANKNFMHLITIETNKGIIEFETYDKDAPKTVQNFIDLTNKGFYDNLIFHRVIRDFMIQGGDPEGTGMGGPGYKFSDELDPTTESYAKGYVRGAVAMANSGPNTNGSQFFIMHQNYDLPHLYTIFGRVTKGIEVVDMIASVEKDKNNKPLQPVIMKKVTVSEKK